MGGHGGLNILPQKRWNVYGRENRLKVSQDEAKYEEEQAAVRERADQGDRERRRLHLKECARRRYGNKETLTAAEGPAGARECPALRQQKEQQQQQQLEWQRPPAADAWEPDTAVLRGLAAGQEDHVAALEQQQYGQQQYSQQQYGQQQRQQPGTKGGTAGQPRKKQHRQERQAAAATASLPLTLAQLVGQMESPRAGDGALVALERGPGGSQLLATDVARGGAAKALERFSLFAKEEAAAASKCKNPEVEAEKRVEQRRRGNVDTQTSDARFDEQFMFAHKLYGQAAMPWYAKKGSTLPSEDGGTGQQQQQWQGGGMRQMWQWEMQGRAALAGAGKLHHQEQQAQEQGSQQAQPALLAGVKVVQNGGAAGGKRSREGGSSSTSGSSSSSDSSSSDSDNSSQQRRSSKHCKRRHRDGSRRRGKTDKEGKRHSREEKHKGDKKGGGKKSLEQLRLERLQREEGERARQQRVLAVAAGRDPTLVGKKYHQGFGFGRS